MNRAALVTGGSRGWARPEMMLQPSDVASAIEGLLDRAVDDVPPELVLESRRQVWG